MYYYMLGSIIELHSTVMIKLDTVFTEQLRNQVNDNDNTVKDNIEEVIGFYSNNI